MDKKTIIEKVRAAAESRHIEQSEKVAVFHTMGGGLCESGYNGDIFNHRVRCEFELNGCKWLTEVTACDEKITLHKITRQPLKHIKSTGNDNGAHIEINIMNAPSVERSASGVYGLFESEKVIASDYLYKDLSKPAHTFRHCINFINRELRTSFSRAILLYTFESAYKTVNEAINYEYLKTFEEAPTPAEQIQLLTQARHCWEGLQYVGIVPSDENFMDHYCWISSGSLHGYYFPNSRGVVRCFAFDRWNEILIVLNDEEE